MKKIMALMILLACIFLVSYGFILHPNLFYQESGNPDNQKQYNSLIRFENYSFSSDDENTLFIAPDGWGPMLVFDSGTSYQQIDYLMEKYFSDLNVSWKIKYDEHYMNYILYSTDKRINDEITFFGNQSCYCYDPGLLQGMNILENPKTDSKGTMAYLFSLLCSSKELDEITLDEGFKDLDISETALVYLYPEEGKKVYSSDLISRLDDVNDEEYPLFVLKANTGTYYPQIFKEAGDTVWNSSEKLAVPSVYFKFDTPDEVINDILEKNIPEGVSWKIDDSVLYGNYYFDCSKGNLTDNREMLHHFHNVIFESYNYEEFDFEGDNTGECYYPVTITKNEDIIVGEMENMGLSLEKTKKANINYQPRLNSSQINNESALKAMYSDENVLFIIMEFCTDRI